MIITTDTIKTWFLSINWEKKLKTLGFFLMKRTDLITSIKPKLGPSEIKSAGESKNAWLFKEKSVSRVIKHMDWEKMLTISNMSWLRIEKKKREIKMRSIDWEMPSLSKKENVKIMMPRSKVLTTIYIKLRKKHKSFPNWLMQKTLKWEEQLRPLILLRLNWRELRMTIQDLWLSLKLFRGTLMANSPKRQISKDKLKTKTQETETCKLNCLIERPDYELPMIN